MSYTTAYGFKRNKPARLAEYGNAGGSGPFIWDTLAAKYGLTGFSFGPDGTWNQLWRRVNDGVIKLRPWELVALKSTYDGALVARADLNAYADALDMFHEAYATAERVCHTHAMAETARQAARERYQALGFHLTSVADNPWSVYIPKRKDYRRYDLKRDTDHWFVDFAQAGATPPEGAPARAGGETER